MPGPWVFLGAGALDEAVGDPEGWPHPVRMFGTMIRWADRTRRPITSPLALRCLGILLALGLPGLAAAAMAAGLHACGHWGWVPELILSAWMLAGRSLREAVKPVAAALAAGDLPAARKAVGLVVGRDVAELDGEEVGRAGLETLAESLCDGVVAPLFWFAVAGLPGLWAFKAASTLDSMVGHREEPWTQFGWASARLDDLLNWVPARLTVVLIAVAGGSGRSLAMAWRDGRKTASPNAGPVEAAFAGALGLQLGGINLYDGVPHPGPLLGDPGRPRDTSALAAGLRLSRKVNLLALGCGALACFLKGLGHG